MKIILISLLFSFSSFSETVDRVVAVVNNDVVTESDIKSFQKRLDNPAFVDDLLLLGKTPDQLKKNRADMLDFLIHERIVDNEIRRMNLTVTMERVNQEIGETAKRNGVARNELLETVKRHGISTSEYQDFIKSRIERQSLVEAEVTSKIRISDEDVLAHYLKSNPNSDSTVFEYTLSHIFFNPKKGGEVEAQERANKVLQKLKLGDNFEILAEQNSEDSNFSAGGFLGIFKAGEFGSDLEKSVSKLQVGEFSDVVKSKNGFHIMKVTAKKIVSDPRYEKEKEKIRAFLFEQAFHKNFKSWLSAKREDAFIKINK